MGMTEIVFIALALSMDAFAAAVCQGLCLQNVRARDAAVVAGFFGGFQALMPLIGFSGGLHFGRIVGRYDHWIVFGLLSILGVRMILEARKPGSPEDCCEAELHLQQVFFLAVATSIDALAMGFTFALIPGLPIYSAVSLIGLITFLMSYLGVSLGSRLNAQYQTRAEIAGGLILIAIGAKTLLTHFGLFV